MHPYLIHHHHRRGAAALLAMLFLSLFATLTLAMYSTATLNVQSARNLSDATRAHAAAESGMRWMCYRLVNIKSQSSWPRPTEGEISDTVASGLWTGIADAINVDLQTMLNTAERGLRSRDNTQRIINSQSISMGTDAGSYVIEIAQHGVAAGDILDHRYFRVTSIGTFGTATASVSMDFKIDKKIKYAVVGKVPIQLGRNVLVEGSIAMETLAQPSGQSPLVSLSDFKNLNATMTARVNQFQNILKANYSGYDNRINVNNTTAWNAATAAGFTDASGDGYIDEYDIFIAAYGGADKKVTEAGFTSNGLDPDLLKAVDALGAPLYVGDTTRAGFKDLQIDNRDGYAKVRGQVLVAETADSLLTRLQANGQYIQDVIQGPIIPTNPGDAPVKFGAGGNDFVDLTPSNFQGCSDVFKAQAGARAGATTVKAIVAPNVGPSVIENANVTAADANGEVVSGVVQKTRTGDCTPSVTDGSHQAKYNRPVFTNVTFRNCKIARGTNALFKNCTFEGVTFVDMAADITRTKPTVAAGGTVSSSSSDGMTWAKMMKSGSFSKDTPLTTANSYAFDLGNNLRFDSCTFHGPVASTVPSAYSHFSNSWEFTGATLFDNPDANATATIVAPQANIEMGSFSNPSLAPSKLVGVVVAGNLDIRGRSEVDGSVIITGDGAGNTTLGWFGANDSTGSATAPMPEGGYGRLNLRYNPYRSLPNGIRIPIDMLPDPSTYRDGAK